ncbi:MAG: cysteine-rich KTR domain-containing protein [Lachnospirales bacterium]
MLQTGKWNGKIVTVDGKIICPICGRPTKQRVRPETRARNLPIWCGNCRKESLVNIDESLSQCRVTTSA